jgi:DNA replication protein dnaC
MSFCSFSREFNENAYTAVENQFITKYMPGADDFAVKVYLYGLYLCQNSDSDFNVFSMAEVLKTTREKIEEAFAFWEDYDLVEILSHEPFVVNYLPVRSAVGRPKKIRYEQYGDFNKELQRKMQQVGKFVSYNDSIKYMHFLDENNIQPQAFLLIAEYCINKQGESVSPSYIFNKAKKFIRNGWTTYEQVERELSNYNAHEGDLIAVFGALSVFKKPEEADYSLYEKWTETFGFSKGAVLEAAKHLKRGNTDSLDILLTELSEKGKTAQEDVKNYLAERDMLASLTFRIGRKLGVKVSNPAPYIDEYTEKWYNCGFEESSLSDIALFCLRTDRNDFNSMNELVRQLFSSGIVSAESVEEYLKAKNAELKLFTRIQSFCGSLKKSVANLSLIETWHSWNFSDEMILEAAKRSAGSGNPIPYMNKILSDWKHSGISSPKDIPEKSPASSIKSPYVNPAVEAINAKADRERYYARLREKAQSVADKYMAKANSDPRFKEISAELSRMEIALAKAEVFQPETLPALKEKKAALTEERKQRLKALGIPESKLVPQYKCKKCSDTGFLPSGEVCDCYEKKDTPEEEFRAVGGSA